MKKFKDIRDEQGRVHNARKQPIATFIAKGMTRPFEVGDRVFYSGVVKANYGKAGVLTGVRDKQGFYITFDDGTKASTTVGALQLIRPHKVEKPKEEAKPKPKAAKAPKPIPEDHAIEEHAERVAENIATA